MKHPAPDDDAPAADGLESSPSGADLELTAPILPWPRRPALRRAVAILRGLRNAGRALSGRLHHRPRPTGPHTVLITGASTGVGLALARRLLKETRHRLVLTARKGSLGRFAVEGLFEGPRVMIAALDVTRDHERKEVFAQVVDRWGGVDILVNNAGLTYRGVMEHVSTIEAVRQMDTNFFGPMSLIRLVLPRMRSQRFGHIVNVSSVGGMTAMPTMGAYSASKFALEGASEALWYEVRPWHIHVTLVRPGFIHSEGFKHVRYTPQADRAWADPQDPYHTHYFHMNLLIDALMNLTFHDSDDVAETICSVIEARRPPLRVAATWDAWIFDLLRRLLPRGLYHRLLYYALPKVWEWGQAPRAPEDPGDKRQS